MCWLNSCSPETRTLTEEILTLPGSRYVPSGVVMRDKETGQMVIVEYGASAVIIEGHKGACGDVLHRVWVDRGPVCYPTKKGGP